MKKFFIRRHLLFFITIIIFAVLQVLMVVKCAKFYKSRVEKKEYFKRLKCELSEKSKELPQNHIKAESQMRKNIDHYMKLISENYGKLISMQHLDNPTALPSNHTALFFEVRSYITWAKNTCDTLGIEVDPTCSFGFQNFFNRKETPTIGEIYDRHTQEEQTKILLSCLIEPKSDYLKILALERGDTDSSQYFEQDEMFASDFRQLTSSDSHVYKVQFVGFTDTLRNFLKGIYDGKFPIIIREIDVKPNKIFRMNKPSDDQISECLASIFTVVVEFLDVPESISSSLRKNAAVYRMLEYQAL